MLRLVRKHDLVCFLIVSMGFTWALWTPVMLATLGLTELVDPVPRDWYYDLIYGRPLTASHVLMIVGIFGPMIGAVIVIAAKGGSHFKDLCLRTLTPKGASALVFLAALVIPMVYNGGGVLVAAAFTGSEAKLGGGPLRADEISTLFLLFLYSLITMTVYIASEEVGWRGYLQPRLQSKMSALSASAIVAVIWAYWHTPYYIALFYPPIAGPSALLPTLSVVALAPIYFLPMTILYTAVFNAGRGSILAVMLFHASNNTSLRLFYVEPADQAVAQNLFVTTMNSKLAVASVMAIAIVVFFGYRNLSTSDRFRLVN